MSGCELALSNNIIRDGATSVPCHIGNTSAPPKSKLGSGTMILLLAGMFTSFMCQRTLYVTGVSYHTANYNSEQQTTQDCSQVTKLWGCGIFFSLSHTKKSQGLPSMVVSKCYLPNLFLVYLLTYYERFR